MKLRYDQESAIRAVSSCYIDGKKGVLLQMSTGTGKTVTASFIVKKYAATTRTVLWLVHRNELLFQASMTFAKLGINHQLIASSKTCSQAKVSQFKEFDRLFIDDTSTVYIASVQTIVRRIESMKIEPHQIIADECHLSLNKTFRTIIDSYPNARLLGLSATPSREDKKPFSRAQDGVYDEMVCGLQTYEAIELGFLCDYEIYIPPTQLKNNNDFIKMKGNDYDPTELEKEFQDVVFADVVDNYRKLSHNKPAIAFCPTVKIAEEFTRQFKAAGYNAALLEGNTDASERFKILQQLAQGKIHVVLSVDILIEGTDVPIATTAIMLRKTKSVRIYLQSVGRVLRTHPKKEKAIILDFVGLVEDHGYPCDHRDWSLAGNVKRKAKVRELEEDEVASVQTCPECYRAHEPSPACPSCGYSYDGKKEKRVKVVKADLVKLEKKQKREQEKIELAEKEAKRVEEMNCKTYKDWYELAKSRSYKFPQKWAWRRHKLRCR